MTDLVTALVRRGRVSLLEATSLLVAFRPRLHRVWGVGLIVFHVGTQVAMGFTFRPSIILLGLLFVCSPAAPAGMSVSEVLLDLPGVRIVSRLRSARGRSSQRSPGRAAVGRAPQP